ncbi:unnamed protein product [Meloidogyne enterolobii]|uniref:Uncharacterized protein n=1 Tax=Meloidogyne enterolobii TaxID=390850 RepID=A0ACB0ZR10_MELEN
MNNKLIQRGEEDFPVKGQGREGVKEGGEGVVNVLNDHKDMVTLEGYVKVWINKQTLISSKDWADSERWI